MIGHQHDLVIGGPRNASMSGTMRVFISKLRGLSAFSGGRMLDVGCGGGEFTRVFGAGFREVCGIDIQEPFLEGFRAVVRDEPRFSVLNMSASEMSFPNDYFDSIIAIETLEHIPDLAGAAREIARVLRPGGELLITVPNRWFPSENHGMKIGSWVCGRVPLLTYWPWLHSRLALARVFTVRDLDSLFVTKGLKRCAVDYAWPTFEHGGNPLQPFLKPLFGLMRKCESSPVRMFGTSVIVKYLKPVPPSASGT